MNPLLRYPATSRLLSSAAGAWSSAGLGLNHPVAVGLLAALSLACLMWLSRHPQAHPSGHGRQSGSGRHSGSPGNPARQRRHTLIRVVISCALFAALGAGLVGASLSFSRTAPERLDAEVQILSDPDQSDSGFYRARAAGPTGGMTLISQVPLPAAGTAAQVTGTLRREGPELTVFADSVEPTAAPAWHWQVRRALRDHLSRAAGDAHAGARLLPGLVIGDTSSLTGQEEDELRAVSLTHITAVSGANISLVGLSVLALARLVTPRRGIGLSAAAAVSACYVFIVGPDPSVIRAAGMGLIGVMAMVRGTGRAGIAMLALAVTGLLCLRPDLATAAGFVLSVAATAALIVLSTPLTNLLMRLGMPRFAAQLIAVPVCAQLGVLPVTVALGQAPGAWSVAANMAAAPAVGAATIIGLAVMCTLPLTLLPAGLIITQWLALPGTVLGWWIMAVARFFAALPGAHSTWPAGLAGLLLACVVAAAGGTAIIAKRRLRAWAGLIAAAALGAGALIPLLRPPLSTDWVVAACNVGQGSATAVRTGDGQAVLIDTGDDPQLLDDCLTALRVRTVVLLVSHFDRDHVGAAAQVPRGGRDLAAWYLSELVSTSADAAALTRVLGKEPQPVLKGSVLTVGDARIEVLWPPPQPGLDSNGGSLVLRISVPTAQQQVSVVVPGDVGADEQRRLKNQLEPADILIAPHHGSRDIEPGFFAGVHAQAGIISVGENSYGHPTRAALLAFGNIPVLRTDQCGTIVITAARRLAGQGVGCSAQLG